MTRDSTRAKASPPALRTAVPRQTCRPMNHTLLHARATARVLGLIVLFSLPACNGDSGGDDPVCEPGTERCPCDSGSCNAGLTCLSSVCVQGSAGSGGTAGNPQGGSGGTSTGGTNTGGSNTDGASGGFGGQSVGGAGGNPAGGAGSGGVTTGGTGGVSGSGGTGGTPCQEDTQTDPENCGQCGRICRSIGRSIPCPDSGCCAQGSCSPYLAECINSVSGFTNCADYCASIGETCAARSCTGNEITYGSWGDFGGCNNPGGPLSSGSTDCGAAIDFEEDPVVRCCCSDTQP
jgi:hypothetical protein